MTKKLILVFVCVVFFSSFRVAFASLSIDEIMYSPTSKQWVEVYNDTDSDIDLSQYKILDAGASKNGHSISSSTTGGSNIIPSHAYGVIALDITSVSATYLFHASLGIKPTTDSSDTVILRDTTGTNPDDTVIVQYNSAVDGNSLQLINGDWVSTTPTPGAINVASSTPPESSAVSTGSLPADYSNSTTSSANTETNNKSSEALKIKTEITTKTLGFVGIPISLQATTFGTSGEKLYFGKYFWNFGDGDSKEINLSDEEPLVHTYYYPGDYLLSLDYFQNPYANLSAPDTSTQVNIKIIPADISISSVGDEKDFFVELSNNTDYNADLSGWILSSSQKSFTLPQNTILPSKGKIMISPKITNFSITDKDTLKLVTPEGNTVSDYSASIPVPVVVATTATTMDKPHLVGRLEPSVVKNQNNDLTASVVMANNTSTNTKTNSSKTIIIFIISFVFIGVAACAVYFVRSKKTAPPNGSDFEILDE